MANNEFIGRREQAGVGIEVTSGTEVAPQAWIKFLSLDFQPKNTTVQNQSAVGRIEMTNDSALVEQWAEGKLSAKVMDISVGYFLFNMFGTCSTALHAGETTVWDNTFTVAQANTAPTLTLTRKTPLRQTKHGLATLSQLEFSAEVGGYAQYEGTLQAKFGVTGTDTPAQVVENEFTAKHITIKNAANTSGLAAATALAVKSMKLTMTRKVTPYFAFGAVDPSAMDTGSWEASGEFVLRYDSTTLEDLHFANTIQAISIALVDTDATIGSSSHPSLTFTAPQARLNDFSVSNDLDNIIEQTVSFYCELSLTAAAALTAVLTNTQNGYAHA